MHGNLFRALVARVTHLRGTADAPSPPPAETHAPAIVTATTNTALADPTATATTHAAADVVVVDAAVVVDAPAANATSPTCLPVGTTSPPPSTFSRHGLFAAAAAVRIPCPLGCTGTHTNRAALGKHLATHHRADATTLANHGFVQCPSGCPGAFCILPKDNRNGQSGLRNHLTAGGRHTPHTALRLASPSGTWISVEDELRRACSVTAAPGTLGASLTLLSHTAAAAADTHAPAASPDAARAQLQPTALALPSDATDPDLDFPIPTLAPSVDLRCALAIPFDDVRRVSSPTTSPSARCSVSAPACRCRVVT
jgi:hypothetical protein